MIIVHGLLIIMSQFLQFNTFQMRISSAYIIISTILCISFVVTPKLTDTLNILLPIAYDEKYGRAQQLISTDEGCYKWQSTSSDIANAQGYPPGQGSCYKKGLVTLQHKGPYPTSIFISSIQTTTDQLFKISLRIRKLERITIFTKYKTMNVKQLQKLQIYGFDEENNTFTSLEGLRFQWNLQQLDESILKVQLQDSSLLLQTNKRQTLQSQGFETDILVVKALKIGKIRVKVRCIEKNYQHITTQTTLYVQQRFELIPPYVNMLANSKFKINMITPTGVNINLPQQFYKVEIGSKFSITDNLMIQAPDYQTSTKLQVSDIRTTPPYKQAVNIDVYEPDQLQIICKQQIIVNQPSKYTVRYYFGGKELSGVTNQLVVDSDFQLKDGYMIANKKMVGKIRAKFRGLVRQKTVYSVLPMKALLPTDYIILPVDQQFKLQVIGGSSIYDYTINSNIATLANNGNIITRKQGEAEILVTDKKDRQNILKIKLKVIWVGSISVLEQQKQSNINEQTQVYVIGKTRDNEYFSKCSGLSLSIDTYSTHIDTKYYPNFEISIQKIKQLAKQNPILMQALKKNKLKVSDEQIIKQFKNYIQGEDISVQSIVKHFQETQNYGICKVLGYKGLNKFDEKLKVIGSRGSHNVQTSFEARVYDYIENKIRDDIRLVPLTTVKWETLGGPHSWDNSQMKVYLNGIQIYQKQPTLKCNERNEKTMNFEILFKNKITQKLLLPVEQKKSLRMLCQYPKKIFFELQKDTNNQYFLQRGIKLNVAQDIQVKGTLYVTDEDDKRFYNDSNIIYEYRETNGKLIQQGKPFRFTPHSKGKLEVWTDTIRQKGQNFQFPRITNFIDFQIQQPLQALMVLSHEKQYLLPYGKQEIKIKLMHISNNMQIKCKGHAIACVWNDGDLMIHVKTLDYGSAQLIIHDKKKYRKSETIIYFQVVEASAYRKIKIQNQKANNDRQLQIQIPKNNQKESSSPSFLSNLKWTDYLIIFMAVNIVIIYLMQKNKQDPNKMKVY